VKIAIIGNGAIGNLVAARSIYKKIPYCLLTRTGQKLELSLTDLCGHKQQFTPEIRKTDSPGEFDILLLPLKAHQIMPALKQVAPYLRQRHIIMLLHNGMGIIEEVRSLLPNNPIVAATTSYGAYKPDQYTLIETGLGQTHGGWVSQERGVCATHVETLLTSLLPPCSWHQDIQQALWHKLAVNAVINPLTAINQITNGELDGVKYRQTIENICQETAEVMQKCGYSSSQAELLKNVFHVIHNTAANFSSMNRDISFKRPTEIDFINGYIIEQSRKHGIDTPCNAQLFTAIKDLEAKY
jgi:2-dehydropantoate 2-reductase